MSGHLKNKVIVVSGGAGLLGSEFIKAIIKEGGIAIIADRDVRNGLKLVKKLKFLRAEFINCDIADINSLNCLIAAIKNKHRRIDALVNCVYPKNDHYGKRFEETTYQDFCENINLHLGGYFLPCRQFSLFFRKQGQGNIINIASVYGVIPPRFEIYHGTKLTNTAEYAVIKAGIIHLTKYLAKYFKGKNVRFNCISPGGISAGQPVKFLKEYNKFCLTKGMLSGKDVSGALIYLLSDASSMVNGQNIIIDDGFSL